MLVPIHVKARTLSNLRTRGLLYRFTDELLKVRGQLPCRVNFDLQPCLVVDHCTLIRCRVHGVRTELDVARIFSSAALAPFPRDARLCCVSNISSMSSKSGPIWPVPSTTSGLLAAVGFGIELERQLVSEISFTHGETS